MDKKSLWMLSMGHAITDLNQGALPAILPFLIRRGGLSYADAAGLAFAMALSSSIVQPLFGVWADKTSRHWLMPSGVFLACVSLAFIGFVPAYEQMFLCAILSGIGIAAFHPEAARLANALAGKKKGAGLGIFSVGGNVGFALGPALMTPALLAFGTAGTAFLFLPGVAMPFLLILSAKRISVKLPAAAKSGVPETGEAKVRDQWPEFSWLSVAIVVRSVVFYSVNTFLPLYWIHVLHQSEAAGGTALAALCAMGAASTLLGGMLADRIGANSVVRLGYVLLVPFLYLFARTTDIFWASALLLPIAFSLFSIASPMVLLGQSYLPNKVGFASGVTLGLAVSVGGLMAPLVGRYADDNGLSAAMVLLSFIPIIGAFAALTLKPPEATRRS
ncbi:MAG: MFS transporter [Candidatus Accumulibacter sp.]|jgi:FSR family fosmidomycin resistance protein-like MFS transporter|nr:MFS transporter [Accumulibacter sp.]